MMKALRNFATLLTTIMLFAGCEKNQIMGDSPCPNCPVVTKIDPAVAQEGSEVNITGRQFGIDKSKVTVEILTEPQKIIIGSSDMLSVTDTEIKFRVPAGKQGMGRIVVKVDVGTEVLASDDAGIIAKPDDVMFAFSGKGQFTITTLAGRMGEELVIKGTNFGTKKEDIKILIGTAKIPEDHILTVSDNEIRFRVPKGLPAKGMVMVFINGFATAGALEFTYITTYTVSTYKYTVPGKIGNEPVISMSTVKDFRVDTTSGVDVLYLSEQSPFYSTISRIAGVKGESSPVITSLGVKELSATDKKELLTLHWAFRVDDKILYHFSKGNATDSHYISATDANSKTTPVSSPVEMTSNRIPFQNVTAANLNELYATSDAQLPFNTDIKTKIYALTRSNTANARFTNALLLEYPSLFSDIEYYNGKLYVTDAFSSIILECEKQSGNKWVIKTFSGGGAVTTDGADLLNAKYNMPSDIAFDKAGSMYICDSENSVIRKISNATAPNATVSIIAGNITSSGLTNGIGTAAEFNKPAFLGIGTKGKIYVYDKGNNAIRVITPE